MSDRKKEKEELKAEERDQNKESHSTNLLVIALSVILGAVSAVMIFVKTIEPIYIVYALALSMIIVGVVMIVRYFVKDEYRNINAYGFSSGVFLILVAICALLRAQDILAAIDVVLGIMLLVMGIIVLQHSMDLSRMKDPVWGLFIVFSVLIIVCGFVGLVKPGSIDYDAYIWWAVMISSCVSLFINIYTLIRVSLFKKKEKKILEQSAAEKAEELPAATTDDAAGDKAEEKDSSPVSPAEIPAGQTASEEAEYMICPECGARISKSSTFCTECGALIEQDNVRS